MKPTKAQSSHKEDDLLEQKDQEISSLKAQVLSLTVDNDELKHHRRELRALNEFYKTQSERFSREAEDAKSQAALLREEVQKTQHELRRARAEMDALRETVRNAEVEVNRPKYHKMGVQSEAEVLRIEASQAKSEADEYRLRVNGLEETFATMPGMSEGVVSTKIDQSVNPMGASSSNPPARETIDIPGAEMACTMSTATAMNADSRVAQDSGPRSPSVEIIGAPPPQLPASETKLRLNKGENNDIGPSSQPSAKVLGKRKAIETEQPVRSSSRKGKPVGVPSASPALSSVDTIEPPMILKTEPERSPSPMQAIPQVVEPSTSRSKPPAQTELKQQDQPSASVGPETARVTRPKFKFKEEEVFFLPPSTVARYLAGAPHLLIKPPPITLQVKREFLRLAYGGSDMQLLQTISAERNPTARKIRRLVFPLFQMNPAMPVVPGESGIMFASRPELLSDGPWGLFRRHLDGKTAVWLYLGDYECKIVGKITKEDFCAQKPLVQRTWARHLITQKAHECYASMRARIALRKAGMMSLGDDAAQEVLVKQEVAKISAKESGKDKKPTKKKGAKNGKATSRLTSKVEDGTEEENKATKPLPVDEDDVIEAFSRGDEGIDIIRMQCVFYDHVFANDIVAQHPNYAALKEAAANEKLANAPKKSNTSTSTASSSRKNRASLSLKSKAFTSTSRRKASAVSKDYTSSEASDSGSTSAGDVPAVPVVKKRKIVHHEADLPPPQATTSTRRSARVLSKPQKTWVEDSSSDDDLHSDKDLIQFSLTNKSNSVAGKAVRGAMSAGVSGGGDENEGELSYASEE